jgi:hypothetical protein
MAHEAGKGDTRRPENTQAYQDNYELIFRKKQQDNVVQIQQLEKERMCGENTTPQSLDNPS